MKLALHLPVAADVRRRMATGFRLRLFASTATMLKTWLRLKAQKKQPVRRRTIPFFDLP